MALVRQRLLNPGLPMETRHSYTPGQYHHQKGRSRTLGEPHLLTGREVGNYSVSESAIDSLAAKLEKDSSEVAHVIYHYAGMLFGSLSPGFKSDKLLADKNAETNSHQLVKIPVKNETMKREIYDLAFSTLKYQALLEEILLDSGYYSYDMIPDENHQPIMVILCNMMQRHFVKLPRLTDMESSIPYVQEIEDDLNKHIVKLNAALARNRIKLQARSIEHLLPIKVREREECSVQLPTYAWINQLRISIPEAMDALREEGYTRVSSIECLYDDSFLQDENCSDVMAFPPGSRERLEETDLVKGGKLIIQDKVCCIGPHSLSPLLSEGDIIHVGVGSGLTTAHLATLTNSLNSTVYGFGVRDNEQLEELQVKTNLFGITNLKFIPEDFLDIQHTDPRMKNVKAVLVTPPDSRSGLLNPVEFIMQEEEDLSILKEMSQESFDTEKLNALVADQMNLLKHAMKFPKVQAVVYATLSIHEEENESVVTKAVEYTNLRTPGTKNQYKIIAPTVPLTPSDLECHHATSRFIKITPSSSMGGCFVAVVSRQDEAMSASDILARAAAKGLYSLSPEVDPERETTEEGAAERKTKRKSPRNKQKSIQKLIRSAKGEIGHGHHGNRKATSPVKRNKPVRTASTMFAHHFERREHLSEPKLKLQPYGVPLTQVTLIRRTSKVDITPPHKETMDHPKPFI